MKTEKQIIKEVLKGKLVNLLENIRIDYEDKEIHFGCSTQVYNKKDVEEALEKALKLQKDEFNKKLETLKKDIEDKQALHYENMKEEPHESHEFECGALVVLNYYAQNIDKIFSENHSPQNKNTNNSKNLFFTTKTEKTGSGDTQLNKTGGKNAE